MVLPGLGRKDEIGDMAQAVETFKVRAEQKARGDAEAQMKQDQAAAQQRKSDMVKLADDFESAVGRIVETVSSSSTQLEASAGTLTSTAERAQELTTMVAAASEQATTNVRSVASATEEMASSINEISRQVQESARMASDAVGQARTTNDRVSELSKAAAGSVTWSSSSTPSPARPTCWRSMRPSRRRAPARPAAALRWLPPKSRRSPSRPRKRPERSASRSPASRPRRRSRWARSRKSRHHRKAVGNFLDDCGGRGRAGCRHPGNFPQRAAGSPRYPAGLLEHHRRAARSQRDRIGLVPSSLRGAIAIGRFQPPEARGRQVPRTRCGRPDNSRWWIGSTTDTLQSQSVSGRWRQPNARQARRLGS